MSVQCTVCGICSLKRTQRSISLGECASWLTFNGGGFVIMLGDNRAKLQTDRSQDQIQHKPQSAAGTSVIYSQLLEYNVTKMKAFLPL